MLLFSHNPLEVYCVRIPATIRASSWSLMSPPIIQLGEYRVELIFGQAVSNTSSFNYSDDYCLCYLNLLTQMIISIIIVQSLIFISVFCIYCRLRSLLLLYVCQFNLTCFLCSSNFSEFLPFWLLFTSSLFILVS